MLSPVNDFSMETILMGDLNINYLKSSNNRPLKDVFRVQSLKQIVDAPTRTTKKSNTLT